MQVIEVFGMIYPPENPIHPESLELVFWIWGGLVFMRGLKVWKRFGG